MKKFTTTFFLLMAMVLLLPTELKAAEDMRLLTVELTDGSYDNYTSKLNFNYDAVNSRYYYDVKSFAGDLCFRIGIKGWSNDIQPSSNKASVPTSEGSTSNAEYGKENAWEVNIPSGSNYTIYVKLGNIVSDGYSADNFRVWIAPTVVVPTTTYTLTYGDKSVTGTVSGDVCTFSNISYAAFGGTETVKFQLKSEESGTTTYYNMPAGTTMVSGIGVTAETGATGSDWTYTKTEVPNKGAFTVTLNGNVVTFTDNTSTSTTPTGNGYYLVGDLSCFGAGDKVYDWSRLDWSTAGGINKMLKLTENADGTYSIRIPGNNTLDEYAYESKKKANQSTRSYRFVIVPESAFSGTESQEDGTGLTIADWTNAIRPGSSDADISTTSLAGVTASNSTGAAWEVKMNGGSYTFTIDPTTNTWSATSDVNDRIMYVATKQDGGFWRATQYLVESNTGDTFGGEHKNQEIYTDGTGMLILHNWVNLPNGEGWGNYNTRKFLEKYAFYYENGKPNKDLAPAHLVPSGVSKYITVFDVPAYYNIIIDYSRGNVPVYIGEGKQNNTYGDFNSPLGREAITYVPVEIGSIGGKYLRTYSSAIDLDFPTGTDVRAYVAYSFDTTKETSTEKCGTVNLRQIDYIPANMGVVIKSETEGELRFTRKTSGTVDSEHYTEIWTKKANYTSDSWNNFLVPVVTSVTIPNGIYTVEDNQYIYSARHFALNCFARTKDNKNSANPVVEGSDDDYIGFFRAKGTVGNNKAYLSLPSSVMDYNGQFTGNTTDLETENNQLSKTALVFDDEWDETTGIKNVDTINTVNGADSYYYNLQGIRVAMPTKGIYIHQGKKVVIK